MRRRAKIRKILLTDGTEGWAIQCRAPTCLKWSLIEPGAQMKGHKPVRCCWCGLSSATCDFEAVIERMKLDEPRPFLASAETMDVAISPPVIVLP